MMAAMTLEPLHKLFSRRNLVKNSRTSVLALSLVLALVAGCGKKEEPAPTAAETPAATPSAGAFDPATGTANVNGKVSFEGAAPKAAQIRMNADPKCVALHKEPVFSQEVLAAGGNLQN